MNQEHVVLVDEQDREIGTEEKLGAHQAGLLHRAVSVFVFNSRGEMLLQRRARAKYHSGGLWSNACCSHPRPGESAGDAAARRLTEELGLSAALEPAFSFIYRAELDAGLVEHELDHVFVAYTDENPIPWPEEVEDWRWIGLEALAAELAEHPARFTAWFPLALQRLLASR